MQKVTLRCDNTPFMAAMSEVDAYRAAGKITGELLDRAVRLFDAREDIGTVVSENFVSAGAPVCLIRLEPGDRLLNLLAALRAADGE